MDILQMFGQDVIYLIIFLFDQSDLGGKILGC